MLRRRGGELAIREQNLRGRERSEEMTCREGGRRVRQRRESRESRKFRGFRAVKSFKRRSCGPEMGEGLPKFSQLVRSQAGPGIPIFQADLGVRSV